MTKSVISVLEHGGVARVHMVLGGWVHREATYLGYTGGYIPGWCIYPAGYPGGVYTQQGTQVGTVYTQHIPRWEQCTPSTYPGGYSPVSYPGGV